MNVKIKKLYDDVVLPTKAHETDACFDIYAYCPDAEYVEWEVEKTSFVAKPGIKLYPGQAVTIDTGFCTDIPEGYFAPVFCRSGLGIKQHVRLSNSVGIIDSSYRGEWKVALHNDGEKAQIIHHGDRIAQFTILPVLNVNLVEAEKLDETERGEGGFGSSGR